MTLGRACFLLLSLFALVPSLCSQDPMNRCIARVREDLGTIPSKHSSRVRAAKFNDSSMHTMHEAQHNII